MKTSTIFIAISLFIGLLFSVFNGFSFAVFIDTVFLISIMTLIYSGFRLLYEKGSFSFISYSMKKVTTVVFKRPDKDGLPSKKVDLEDYIYTTKFDSTKPLFISSILLTAITILIGFMVIS